MIMEEILQKSGENGSPSKINVAKQKVLCNWGMTLKQLSAVHIQASADGILVFTKPTPQSPPQ